MRRRGTGTDKPARRYAVGSPTRLWPGSASLRSHSDKDPCPRRNPVASHHQVPGGKAPDLCEAECAQSSEIGPLALDPHVRHSTAPPPVPGRLDTHRPNMPKRVPPQKSRGCKGGTDTPRRSCMEVKASMTLFPVFDVKKDALSWLRPGCIGRFRPRLDAFVRENSG